ncbi:MAG: MOSC domain-containing protein [Nitriliruptoraceae bacterium]|nr:MOSC domain-containing protein [Nitriliruptoraceae bacterium]
MSPRRTGRVQAVCRAPAGRIGSGTRVVETAIDKRAADGPVPVTSLGLEGDVQADTEHHGGPDQALYAYGQEDADHWIAAFERPLPPGSFGENLRLEAIDVSQAQVGERWRIGSTVEVTVTAPRIPCRVFAVFLDIPDLVSRFLSAGRPGAYLRVDVPGSIQADDRVTVLSRPSHSLSVAEVSTIHTAERDRAAELLELDAVAGRVRAWAQEHLAATGRSGQGG